MTRRTEKIAGVKKQNVELEVELDDEPGGELEPRVQIWLAAGFDHWCYVKRWLEDDPSLITTATGGHNGYCNLSLLHLAFYSRLGIDFIKYLVEQGADIQTAITHDTAPLLNYVAACNPNMAKMKYLISAGANVDGRDRDGCTPLHHAITKNCNTDVLKYLIAQGADINARDNDGRTPLHRAVVHNSNLDVLQYLINQGVDIHPQDNDGNTPYDITFKAREQCTNCANIRKGEKRCKNCVNMLEKQRILCVSMTGEP
jgi:hypothetical protein